MALYGEKTAEINILKAFHTLYLCFCNANIWWMLILTWCPSRQYLSADKISYIHNMPGMQLARWHLDIRYLALNETSFMSVRQNGYFWSGMGPASLFFSLNLFQALFLYAILKPDGKWWIGTGNFPERHWMHHPWRHSRSGWMELWAPDEAVGVPVHCRGVGLDGL